MRLLFFRNILYTEQTGGIVATGDLAAASRDLISKTDINIGGEL